MADQIQEMFLDIPKDFINDGRQFINRCTKRTFNLPVACSAQAYSIQAHWTARDPYSEHSS
jgi:hypothetical protein